MAQKNILVTAIKNNDNHHRCRYYYGEDDSQVLFCDAMASGEAGAKKILSGVNIDEIIAIGSEIQVAEGKPLQRVSLADGIDYIQADLDSMSDLDFFRYRLMEYIKGVDMEAADIAMSVPVDVQNKVLDEICKKVGFEPKKLLAHLPKSKKLKSDFMAALASYSEEEQEWIKRALYHAMDDRCKYSSRTTNFNLPISFIPVAEVCSGDQKNMKNLHQLLSTMKENADDEIHLYVDIHGFSPEESYIFLSFFFALNDSANSKIHIESINSLNDIPNGFLYRISDARKRYNVERLLSGINAFSKYGKADMISDYWRESGINSPAIERMMFAMNSIDVGISLCNIEVLEQGIKTFCTIVNEDNGPLNGSEEEMFLMTLKQGIIADYGPLVSSPDGKFSYLDLVRWAFNKGLYQPAITIIESRFPKFLVENGLFYYARNEEEKKAFMASLNAAYWDSHPKDRWSFDDIEHFFLKFYCRGVINRFNDRSKTRSQVYTDFRVKQVYEEDKLGGLPAFSIIEDKQEFADVLDAYYGAGALRNQINHAHLDEPMTSDGICMELPLKAMIRSSLEKVINTFAIVEKYIGKKEFEIATTNHEEFKAYTDANGPRVNPDYNKVPGYIPNDDANKSQRKPFGGFSKGPGGGKPHLGGGPRNFEHHKEDVSITVNKVNDEVTVKLHWD